MEHSISENGVHTARMGNGAGEAVHLSGGGAEATVPATPQSSGTSHSQSGTPRQGLRGGLTPKGLRGGSSRNFFKPWVPQMGQEKAQEGDGRPEEDVGKAMRQGIESAADAVSHFFRTGRVPGRVQSLPSGRPNGAEKRPSVLKKMKSTGSASIDGAAAGLRRMSKSMVELKHALDSAQRLQELLHKKAGQFTVNNDYTVEIDCRKMPQELQEEFARVLGEPLFGEERRILSSRMHTTTIGEANRSGRAHSIPRLTICILIVGTRGDVQPFIAIGRKLMEFGHRVRLASHANYREFIMEEGLEFYPLGGDPKLLAEYMVKNKGLLPSGPSEVSMQRKQLKAIIDSAWPACTEADVDSGGGPFVADAIIANPPTMAHIHVAEALKVPLHVFFTMPWTPTSEFPSPLATVITTYGFENKLSYYVVDELMWLGISDLINSLRRRLKLKRIRPYHVPHYAIPHGYIWSPLLAQKPADWGPLEDVVGFCFLDLAGDYLPPPDLQDFLSAPDKPFFIGFGSLPVEDPVRLTQTIIDALVKTGQRGIIQKGWGGLGEVEAPPDNVFILGNCPHDWLFPYCKGVIHHGGAGTTAAGLRAGCPTTVVPFFGDQFFWGSRILNAGLGPSPIPITSFSLEKLVAAINFMLQPEVQEAATEIAQQIKEEDGVLGAVNAFHDHLPEGFESRSKATPWLLKTTNVASASVRGCCCR